MNTGTENTHKVGDHVAVVARGHFKSLFVGRTARVTRVRPGKYVNVTFDVPMHGFTESQFDPMELDPIVANDDDEL